MRNCHHAHLCVLDTLYQQLYRCDQYYWCSRLPVTCTIPAELSSCRGIIHHPELQHLTSVEIMKLTARHGVIVATIPSNPTGCMLHWPQAKAVPDIIVRVHKVMPNPGRSHNCQKYGHNTDSCRSLTACPHCSGSHKKRKFQPRLSYLPCIQRTAQVTAPNCPI